MEITLKKALPQDMEFLFDLRKQTMHELLLDAVIKLTDQQHRERVAAFYGYARIIYSSGQKCGMIKYHEDKQQIKIIQFQIMPRFQGQGIGSKVLAQLCALAVETGKKVRLKVLKSSPAVSFYSKAGFQVYDSDDYEYHMIF